MLLNVEITPLIALLLAITGFVSMLFLMPPWQELTPEEIMGTREGAAAKVMGEVRDLKIRNGNAFFELENPGRVKMVYFNIAKEQLKTLTESRRVLARGKVSTYKNEKEMIVEKVDRVD